MADAGETGDLPAAVGQELEQLGGAGGHVEKMLGRLAFLDEAAPWLEVDGTATAARRARSLRSMALQTL